MSEWKVVRLGDICEVYDGPHATPKKTDSGPIFLGIFNLNGGRLDFSKVQHLSEQDFIKWTRRVTPQKDDIVFSYETRIGETAIIPQGLRCCLGRRMGLLRPDTTKVAPRFLLYAYLGPEFQSTLHSRTIHGSTVDRISIGELPSFPIRIPPLPVQRRIARILGRLDDKIDANRRINRALEAMARALYKHWFVEFGPFQDGEFVESELGLIPKGWEVRALEDLLELAYGKGLPKRRRTPGPFPVIGSSGIIDSHTAALVSGPGIVVGRKGTIGKLTWVQDDFWPIDTTYYVVPKSDIYSLGYLYHVLAELNLESRNADSAVPGLNRKETYRLLVVVPPDKVLIKFNRIVTPWFTKIQQSKREIEKLIQTRDYLLPRLLSGEVEAMINSTIKQEHYSHGE